MQPLVSLALAAVLVTLSRVNASPYPFNVARNDVSPLATRSADFIRQLGPQLSTNATIFTDDDPRFINATTRWSEYSKPQISVVVDPGTEADVAIIVNHSSCLLVRLELRILTELHTGEIRKFSRATIPRSEQGSWVHGDIR